MMENRLMTGEQLRDAAKMAVDMSPAEQTGVTIHAGDWALTRFANSIIHQNMASRDAVIYVRAVYGKQTAAGSGNDLTESGIKELVERVSVMARAQDENPDFVSLPEPAERDDAGVCETGYWDLPSAPERAAAVKAVIDRAAGLDTSAAGSYFSRKFERVAANSLGIDTYFRGASSNLLTVVTAPNGGFGYASAGAMNPADIDAEAVGKEAAERAIMSMNPVDLEPGEYETVLMPYAVADMVSMFVYMGFNSYLYQEGRSFVCGKLGEKLVGDNINIVIDPCNPATHIEPYDLEGVKRSRIGLIEDGNAKEIPYDSYTAHRAGLKSRGGALGGEWELGGSSGNFIVGAGESSVEEMIASVKRGVLVTRFHYTNIAHEMTATITGMTRDGTFLIEDGRIIAPVKNLRFTQSVLEALSDVRMIGRDRKLEEGVYAPAMRVGKFRFSSATSF